MLDANFFTKHYEFIEDAGNILMTAAVVFSLALPLSFKVCSVIAAGLAFIWMSHPSKGETPVCGADINAEAIAGPPEPPAK